MIEIRHATVREVAYNTLLNRRRQALHAQVARSILQIYPADEYDDHHAEPEEEDGRHLAENVLDVRDTAEYRRSRGESDE